MTAQEFVEYLMQLIAGDSVGYVETVEVNDRLMVVKMIGGKKFYVWADEVMMHPAQV